MIQVGTSTSDSLLPSQTSYVFFVEKTNENVSDLGSLKIQDWEFVKPCGEH